MKQKSKKPRGALTRWSKKIFSNTSKQLINREKIVMLNKDLFDEDPSVVNRVVFQRARAEGKILEIKVKTQ